MYEVDFTELPKLLNDWIKNIWNDRNRYMCFKGGGGSGKSFGIVELLIYRMIAEQGHKILVVRKVGTTLRESCFALALEVINLYSCDKLFKINKTEMTITCINGNKMLFKSLDDPEKIKSINGITTIWAEECSEFEIQDFRQLNIRLRGKTKYPKQFFISFNPININHWLKSEFFDNKKKDATVVETTYKDNKFLDEAAKKVLEDFKYSDPYYYSVYCLNQWGVTGKTIFDKVKVSERLQQIKGIKPIAQGNFVYEYVNDKVVNESIKWVESDDGYIKIYQQPKILYPYVLGGDTAGDGSDYFVGQVIDNTNGHQVATLRQLFDEDLYSQQMYCLGRYYNIALIGLETNYSTHPTKELQRLGYPNMYMREVEDNITKKLDKKFGFNTSKLTRPIIIADMVTIVRESVECFNDEDTLNEMLTFVRNEKGKATAQEGSHDDCIMAMAITYYIRDQQSYRVKQETQEKKKLLIDKINKRR
mgnify:FL=1